jgi:hypothetical protein
LARPLGAAGTRGPGTPQVRIDHRAADAELLGNRGDRGALSVQAMERLVGRAPGGVPLRLGGLLPLLPGLGALASSPIHLGRGHWASHRRQRLHGEGSGSVEGDLLIVQKGLDSLSQVFDQMKPVDHLHGLGAPCRIPSA